MSKQELEHRNNEAGLGWFERNYPQFFTPKIVAARDLRPDLNPKQQSESQQFWRRVSRRLTENTLMNFFLHIDVRRGTYEFRDGVNVWKITERQLILAISGRGTFVGLRLEGEVFRFNRRELQVAFNELRSLRDNSAKR